MFSFIKHEKIETKLPKRRSQGNIKWKQQQQQKNTSKISVSAP